MSERRVPCPDCGGVGTLDDRKGNEYTCPECEGRGKVEPERIRSFGSDPSEEELQAQTLDEGLDGD